MSPSAAVTMYRSWAGATLSRTNWTCPSANTTIAPPLWKLKISSLGPQLFDGHRQVLGPPNGVALLLIALPLPCGSPDTPNPLSCSAHRQNLRLLLPYDPSPTGSA